jgi:hypothetical protein
MPNFLLIAELKSLCKILLILLWKISHLRNRSNF